MLSYATAILEHRKDFSQEFLMAFIDTVGVFINIRGKRNDWHYGKTGMIVYPVDT